MMLGEIVGVGRKKDSDAGLMRKVGARKERRKRAFVFLSRTTKLKRRLVECRNGYSEDGWA